MSLLFLKLTFITFWLSHWRARKTRPNTKEAYQFTSLFHGSRDDFYNKLNFTLLNKKNFLLLEKTPNKCLISESPSLFSFGSFYHIKLKTTEQGLLVCIHVQPKLVSHSDEQKKEIKNKFKAFNFSESENVHQDKQIPS